MANIKLIADSGSTKTEWCILKNGKSRVFFTQGLSPYFLNEEQITSVMKLGVWSKLKKSGVDEIYFYGTGLKNTGNRQIIRKVLKSVFGKVNISVNNDLFGAARSLCGDEKGIACILGTGSNSCYFNGRKIVKNSPGLGYVLGDEGSGAVLGKTLIQYYLYDLMDNELKGRFDDKFKTTYSEILDSVYKKPMPNRYLASFAVFLAENRGHYMVENILSDCFNEFFHNHLTHYKESYKYPVHFVGSVGFGFRDVLHSLANDYGFNTGNIFKAPMEGLIKYHK